MEEGKLYYSISEVSSMFDIRPSVLRFWETEFPSLKPAKNQRGARIYKQSDIALLKQIYHLTRECGLTLQGAKEHIKNSTPEDDTQQLTDTLTQVRQFLTSLKDQL